VGGRDGIEVARRERTHARRDFNPPLGAMLVDALERGIERSRRVLDAVDVLEREADD